MEAEPEGDETARLLLEERQRVYEKRLHSIQQNESEEFSFGDDYDQDMEAQWTVEQWNELFTQLFTKNTSVETIIAGIQVCPVKALSSFAGYLRTTKKIKELTVQYEPLGENFDRETYCMPKKKRSRINDILHAVGGNPFIKRLTLRCLGNPQSIQDLLSRNVSLESFTLRLLENHNQISDDMASCIASGLKQNKGLRHVGIFVKQRHLDTICAGLSHHRDDGSPSRLESLTLWTNQPENNPRLGSRILEAIQCCPSLKTLTVKKPDYSWDTTTVAPCQPWVDYVLKHLRHPEHAGLKILRLEHLTLGAPFYQDASDDAISPEQANTTFKKLILDKVMFPSEKTAGLLLNLRGLRILRVRKLSYWNTRPTSHNSVSNYEIEDHGGERDDDAETSGAAVIGEERSADADDESARDVQEGGGAGGNEEENSSTEADDESTGDVEEGGGDDGNEVNNNFIDYWAHFIRQCADLHTADFDLDDDMDIDSRSRMLESVLKGARGHAALENLSLAFQSVQMPGARLRLLLQQILLDTDCLKRLELDDIRPHEDLTAGLAAGLRGNKSLRKLVFRLPYTAAGDGAQYVRVLDCLSENHTLQDLSDATFYDIRSRWTLGRYGGPYPDDDNQAICQALERLFPVNTSLRHIVFPAVDLRQGQMSALLGRLGQSKTLKSIDMSNCETDVIGFMVLGLALMDDRTIPVEHIVLPCLSPEHSTGSLSTDLADFFHGLVRMRRMKTVDFDNCSWPITEDEDRLSCLKLLLRAATGNKYIQSFGAKLHDMEENDSCVKRITDIDYYLKLNRFGRHGLDAKNLRRSIWPKIFAPMTGTAKDADALFFFIREYFMRNSYPLRQQQHRPNQKEIPLSKRARLDGDNYKES